MGKAIYVYKVRCAVIRMSEGILDNTFNLSPILMCNLNVHLSLVMVSNI